jgi:hypothetical protein
MRVGIVAEGRGDLAALVNVLKGALDLDFEDIQFIRPEYDLDETDIHNQTEVQRGGWVRVKRECQEGVRIREFVANVIDDEFLVVVQIDTAEAHEKGYDVVRPPRKDPEYAVQLRERVVDRITGWLSDSGGVHVRYAVAVEEIDAWILTIFSNKDTTSHGDPKTKLKSELIKAKSAAKLKHLLHLKEYGRVDELTRPFRSRRELERCARRNSSLQAFLASLPTAL